MSNVFTEIIDQLYVPFGAIVLWTYYSTIVPIRILGQILGVLRRKNY